MRALSVLNTYALRSSIVIALFLIAQNAIAQVSGCPEGQAIRGINFAMRSLVCVPIPNVADALATARSYTDQAVATEIVERKQADTADRAAAKLYTDQQIALNRAQASIPVIWSARCSSDNLPQFRGDRVLFCADKTEPFNTAMPSHLKVSPQGEITVLQEGFYRVNFHATSRNCEFQTHSILQNGAVVHTGVTQVSRTLPGLVQDVSGDVVWRFTPGDVITIEGNSACSGQQVFEPSLSRLQIQYLGPSQ
jgi:hypothetical protein